MSVLQLSRALGWATYLGCSWTWCIGMFLPSLLLRDFGWPAWIVFAAPNVIGAAAMGFVFADREASERFVTTHRPACIAFSSVTVLFQLYFLVWAAAAIRPPIALVGGLLVLLCLLCWITRPDTKKELPVSGLVFVLSLMAMIGFARRLPFSVAHLSHPAFGTLAPQLVYLLPVFLFGFLLSPYLDLTFHHAAQQTTKGVARIAFALGFGLFFFSMLVFALLYAPSAIAVFFAPPDIEGAPFGLVNRTGLCYLLFGHFALQAGFTAILHGHRMNRQVQRAWGRNVLSLALAIVAALLLWALAHKHTLFGLTGPEWVYRVFMAFYGLCAPTYIWTCVIPFKTLGIHRKVDWATCALSLCLAAPCFAGAFLAGHYPMLVPGMGIVLLAPLIRRVYYASR